MSDKITCEKCNGYGHFADKNDVYTGECEECEGTGFKTDQKDKKCIVCGSKNDLKQSLYEDGYMCQECIDRVADIG